MYAYEIQHLKVWAVEGELGEVEQQVNYGN